MRKRLLLVAAVAAVTATAAARGVKLEQHHRLTTTERRQPELSSRSQRRSDGPANRGIRSDLFGVAAHTAPAVMPSPPAYTALCAAPPEADPLAAWAYVGYAAVSGKPIAMLERRDTHEGRLLAVGDEIAGRRIAAITRAEVNIENQSERRSLPMNQRYSLVPLDRNASARPGEVDEPPAEAKAQSLDTGLVLSFDAPINLVAAPQADAEHLQDEVFEGRMRVDEMNRRLAPQSRAIYFGAFNRSYSSWGMSSLANGVIATKAQPSVERFAIVSSPGG